MLVNCIVVLDKLYYFRSFASKSKTENYDERKSHLQSVEGHPQAGC